MCFNTLEMEPVAGFEPATDGLQNRCSTTELNWRTDFPIVVAFAVARKPEHPSEPGGSRANLYLY